MNLPESQPHEPHLRLLTDALAAPLSLALAGGYALQAHGLLERPHRNVDFATESAEPMPRIARILTEALTARGREVSVQDTDPLSAHLSVTDPTSGTPCDLALHKETLWSPPVLTPYGPTLALEDAVGTKIRALYDRGLAVDLIDARAAAARFPCPRLEELARRHARDDFDLPTLQTRLEGGDYYPDSSFTAYGLTEDEITGLRAWALAWSTDIAERLLEEGASPDETQD
ncbi:nucleotidyl transferase AbiEii/AbiGii toxin family protein [Streptomyces sp. NPDC006739]|uniref:nucleotidyl transferase AbiEii/AbiGii toxin family protein n=1 Tax=Streptomyces sp. NPDC006739 TaxID=3364763 RepID=UPI0036C8761E